MEEELQQLESLKEQLILYFATNGTRLLLAIIILFAGIWIGKRASNLILKVCEKRAIDPTLARFFSGFSKLLIVAFASVMALSKAALKSPHSLHSWVPVPSA